MIYYGASYSEMQSHKYLNIYHMWSAQKEDITKMHDKKQHQIVPWWFLAYTAAACYGKRCSSKTYFKLSHILSSLQYSYNSFESSR